MINRKSNILSFSFSLSRCPNVYRRKIYDILDLSLYQKTLSLRQKDSFYIHIALNAGFNYSIQRTLSYCCPCAWYRESSGSKCLTLTISIDRLVMYGVTHNGNISEDDIAVHGARSSSSSSSSSTSSSSTSLSSSAPRCNAPHVEPPVATGQSNFHRRKGEPWIFIRSDESPVLCTYHSSLSLPFPRSLRSRDPRCVIL